MFTLISGENIAAVQRDSVLFDNVTTMETTIAVCRKTEAEETVDMAMVGLVMKVRIIVIGIQIAVVRQVQIG